MRTLSAQIIREYGPFAGVDAVHGVTYDQKQIWFAAGEQLHAVDTSSGAVQRSIEITANAGTAFDGQHLFQIANDRIQKIDPQTGAVVDSIPAPEGDVSGLAWAEGKLWVGAYKDRKIHQVDPASGAILRTVQSNRYVTGVTWVDGQLWHATWEDDACDLRHIDPQTGEVLQALDMPSGSGISGLESDGDSLFFCGGGNSGKIRVVRRPGHDA